MQSWTHLWAFAFGELQGAQRRRRVASSRRFATKAHQANELDFALDTAKRSIEFSANISLTKHQVSTSTFMAVVLPDFSAGAMKTGGLVTYREAYLLLDPDNTALTTKHRSNRDCLRIGAPMVQGFSDNAMVDDLWLNESFANMMNTSPSMHLNLISGGTFGKVSNLRSIIRSYNEMQPTAQSVHVQATILLKSTPYLTARLFMLKARMLVMVRGFNWRWCLTRRFEGLLLQPSIRERNRPTSGPHLAKPPTLDVGAIMNSWFEQPGYPVVPTKSLTDN